VIRREGGTTLVGAVSFVVVPDDVNENFRAS
jgi:hypothetical protein